ncbi:unnamed protein product [Adineta ricciae]|uniref:Uncharacterized protein n=1 Tax=Adineta ricciae TaxID=249248 RepID=A0A816EHJ1_ADIRI|nr:unnamed protein product [Adineta ricciae]
MTLVLRMNQTLTTLYLNSNGVDHTGAYYLSIGLRENTTLTKLDLRQNRIGDEGARHMADSLPVQHVPFNMILVRNSWI